MMCTSGTVLRETMPQSSTQSSVSEVFPHVTTTACQSAVFGSPQVTRAGLLTLRGHAVTKLGHAESQCNNNFGYTVGHAKLPRGSDDEDGAEVVDVGQGRAGYHLITERGEETVPVVVGQRRCGVEPELLAPAHGVRSNQSPGHLF